MESSIIIAKILWPFLMILTLAVMLNQKNFEAMLNEVSKSKIAIFYISTFRLIVGILIVLFHNVWTWRLELVITILGWVVLLSGITWLVFPEDMMKLARPVVKQKKAVQTCITTTFVLGAVLVFVGYGIYYPL